MKNLRKRILPLFLFLAFVAFTVLVRTVDFRSVGPEGTAVGFATVNLAVWDFFGVNLTWYDITDWLGLLPVAVGAAFAVEGLLQWVKQKSLRKVDRTLLVLGAVYIVVLACYILFEYMVINYRPVILGRVPEASYPSSHTMAVVCVMGTAILRVRQSMAERPVRRRVLIVAAWGVMAVTVVGRLLSGVHWLTDIVGALLLSSSVVALYAAYIPERGTR